MNIKSISSVILVVCSIALFFSMTGCTSREEKDATAKANGDIARIRELKEIEAAERDTAKKSNQLRSKAMTEGAAKPLRDLKY